MTYKELITRLQTLPPIPVPVKIYPSRTGEYRGSRWYSTGQDEAGVIEFSKYLSILNNWKNVVLEGRTRKDLNDLAIEITKNSTGLTDKTKAIHRWVFNNINYLKTPILIPPWDLIRIRIGDCKSFSVLTATLLGIVGVRCWFKLVQMKGYEARHIYDYAEMSWFPIDGTGAYPFQEVQRVTGYMLFEIDRTSSWPPMPLPSPVEAEEVPWPIPLFTGLMRKIGYLAITGVAIAGLFLSVKSIKEGG